MLPASSISAGMFGDLMLAVLCLAATADDLKRRKIGNRITMPAMLAGLAASTLASGWTGMLHSAIGLCLPLLLLPLWINGWMGAGDVKLMMATGSLLGAADGARMMAGVLLLEALCGMPLLLGRRLKGIREPLRLPMAPFATAVVAAVRLWPELFRFMG